MLIDMKKIQQLDLVISHREMSTSGKYCVFFGEHFVKGKICYDVGAFNGETCECHRLHFGEDKPGAMIKYDNFREKMTEGATPEEEQDEFHIM